VVLVTITLNKTGINYKGLFKLDLKRIKDNTIPGTHTHFASVYLQRNINASKPSLLQVTHRLVLTVCNYFCDFLCILWRLLKAVWLDLTAFLTQIHFPVEVQFISNKPNIKPAYASAEAPWVGSTLSALSECSAERPWLGSQWCTHRDSRMRLQTGFIHKAQRNSDLNTHTRTHIHTYTHTHTQRECDFILCFQVTEERLKKSWTTIDAQSNKKDDVKRETVYCLDDDNETEVQKDDTIQGEQLVCD